MCLYPMSLVHAIATRFVNLWHKAQIVSSVVRNELIARANRCMSQPREKLP